MAFKVELQDGNVLELLVDRVLSVGENPDLGGITLLYAGPKVPMLLDVAESFDSFNQRLDKEKKRVAN
jgi:hypothetical protein